MDNTKTLPLTFLRQNASNKVSIIFTLTVFSDISLNKKAALLRVEGDGGERQFSSFQVTYGFSVHNF